MNINYSAWLFLLGVLIFQTFSSLPSLYWLFALVPMIILVAYLPRGWPLYIVLFGIFWSFLFVIRLLLPTLDVNLEGQDVEVGGVVQEVISTYPGYSRFVFQVSSETGQPLSASIPRRLMLSWYSSQSSLQTKQKCKFTVRLKKHWRFANPGSVDSEKLMFIQGIGARGYVRSGSCDQSLAVNTLKPSVRDQMINKSIQVKDDYTNYGLMSALTFGEREYLTDQQWHTLRVTGTIHLVAISGLHLSVVSAFSFFLINFLLCRSAYICERCPAKKIAALGTILIALAYAYIAGFTIPTQRALVMVTVVLLAVLLGKSATRFSVFSAAILAILLWNPLTVLTTSFWMSFSAVFFILLVIKSCLPSNRQWLVALRIQLYLSLALLPISLWAFQLGSIIAPLVNLIAVPYVSMLVLPLLLISQTLFLLDFYWANNLLSVCDYLFDGLWWLLEYFERIPWASWRYQPTLLSVVAFEIGLILWIVRHYLPVRNYALLLMAALILPNNSQLEPGQMKVAVLDVGQGLSVVMQTKQHALIYDTGPSYASGFNTGSAVVLPYLQNNNINSIDVLMLSHSDNDHAGSASTILAAGVVNKLMVNDAFTTTNPIPIKFCRQGDEWQWDNVKIEILHPPHNWHSSDNNRSCVMQVIHPAGKILLTGDIEATVERKLVAEYGDKLRSDILIAPHHGSQSSSSRRFLASVRPQMAIFSVGYRNRYGFPHANILSRYQEINSQYMTTASEGAILIQFDAQQGIHMERGYRHRTQRYWHSDHQN